MTEESVNVPASLPQLAEAKLQRQNERIRQADAALTAAPMERQRSDSNSKRKTVKNDNLTADAMNRRAGSQELDSEVAASFNDDLPRLRAPRLSRSLSTASHVTGSSRNDEQNNSVDLQDDQDQDGFQVVYSRKSRRTLSINNPAAAAPPKTATKESLVTPHEVSTVFGNALPGTSFLASNMGRSSGQLQFIKHPNGDVSAHVWSGSRMQWENVGQFSHTRKRIEGQLAVCRLKGETASQMRRQNTLAYFRAVARQKEAELLGVPFGTADVKALLPDPVSKVDTPQSNANQARTSRTARPTRASLADDPFLRSDSRHPMSDWTPAPPTSSAQEFGLSAAPSISSVTRSARDTLARGDSDSHQATHIFPPRVAMPFAQSSTQHTSAASSSSRTVQSAADTNTASDYSSFRLLARQSNPSSLLDLCLVPQKPTIDKSTPAALFFQNLKLSTSSPHLPPSAQTNDSRNAADDGSALLPQTSAAIPDGHVRGALRGQLIRLSENARGRSISGTPTNKIVTQDQSLTTQGSPAKTPFRTVLHDPYRTDQPTALPSVPTLADAAQVGSTDSMDCSRWRQLMRDTTSDSSYFPNYTQPFTSAAASSSLRPSQAFGKVMTFRSEHASSIFDPFMPSSRDQGKADAVPSSSAIDRRPLPANTFDIRGGSIFPKEESSSRHDGTRAEMLATRVPQATSSALADKASLLQARHEYSTDPTFSNKHSSNPNNLTGWKAYDDRLRKWWNGDNKFQRQEDFYKRIKAAQRISSPVSAKRQASGNANLQNRSTGSSPPEASSQFNGPLTRVLIPVFENLETYFQPSINAAPDYWCPWASSRSRTNRFSSVPAFLPIDSPLQTYSTTTPMSLSSHPSDSLHRVPEWAIDRGPKGNDSFWDAQEWGMPPARVGRDTRYSSSGSVGVGGFSMGGIGMGRTFGASASSSVSTSPVVSRGLGRLGGR
jgi:hypothetical protein